MSSDYLARFWGGLACLAAIAALVAIALGPANDGQGAQNVRISALEHRVESLAVTTTTKPEPQVVTECGLASCDGWGREVARLKSECGAGFVLVAVSDRSGTVTVKGHCS